MIYSGVKCLSRKCSGCWQPLNDVVQRCPTCGRINPLPTQENIVFSAPHKSYDIGIEKKYGSKYDRVICIKPQDIPSDVNGERKLKEFIWKKIRERLG